MGSGARALIAVADSDLESSDSKSVQEEVNVSVLQPDFVRALGIVEGNLLQTLDYIERQLAEIEHKTKNLTRFSRNVFEVKKLFIEQKLNLLKQLSSLALDKKRHGGTEQDAKPNISDILGSQ